MAVSSVRSTTPLGAIPAFALAILMSSHAAAQEHPVLELRFEAPPECRDARGFRDRMVSRLGYDPFVDDAEDVLELHVVQGEDGYHATARLTGRARGARELGPSATCSELMTAVATTISILVDPLAVPRVSEPEPAAPPIDVATEVNTDETTTTAIIVIPEEVVLPTPPPPLQVGIGAHGGANIGVAPAPMSEFDLEVALSNGTWSGELGGRIRHSLVGVSVADDSVVLGFYTGRISGCYEAIALACLELELGAYVGDAAERALTRSEFFAALGLRGGVRWAVSPGFALDALLTLTLTPTPLRIWFGDTLGSEMLPVAGSLVIGAHFFPSRL